MQEAFFNYVWGFYGKGGIYADTFSNNLTKKELKKAISERLKIKLAFYGDSADREIVRDIALKNRLEHANWI